MALTKYEQEVMINFSADGSKANIYCANPYWLRKIDKLRKENPGSIRVIREGDDFIEIEVPKFWIKVQPKRFVSEEQRENARERFVKLRAEHPEKFFRKTRTENI